MDEGYKEVYFGEYCKTCEFKDTPEEQLPCTVCLDDPVNLHSHKPTKYKQKEGGK